MFPQHGSRADCKALDKSNRFWQHQVLNKSNLFPQHDCRADCQVLDISNGGACQVIYKSNLFGLAGSTAAEQLSSSKKTKLSWKATCQVLQQQSSGAACQILNRSNYSWSTAAEQPSKLKTNEKHLPSTAAEQTAKFLTNQTYSDNTAAEQLPSFKQVKFISTARLQSRLSSSKHQQWRGLSSYIQIKLILEAQLRNSCHVLRKSNLPGKPHVKL